MRRIKALKVIYEETSSEAEAIMEEVLYHKSATNVIRQLWVFTSRLTATLTGLRKGEGHRVRSECTTLTL